LTIFDLICTVLKTFSYKTKQFFFLLIKISIIVVAFYFIYKKLLKNEHIDFSVFYNLLIKNEVFSSKIIFLLSFLSLLNWFFEILKWQILASKISKITFRDALAQSLGSLTASLLTPNRIGEYGAKALFFKKESRKQIMLANLLGNSLQMGITCLVGFIGLYFFILKYPLNFNYHKLIIGSLISISILTLIIYLILKIKVSIKGFFLEKIKNFILNLNKRSIIFTLFYALIRYLLFSFQFYYLLVLFDADVSYLTAMMVISSMYLLSSVIPSIFIFDVVIKGSVSLFLFSFVGVDDLIVLSTVMMIWLFNFVFPSLIGSYYVLTFKLPSNTNLL